MRSSNSLLTSFFAKVTDPILQRLISETGINKKCLFIFSVLILRELLSKGRKCNEQLTWYAVISLIKI